MKTLTQNDLSLIKDKAISYFVSYSPRCRLEGMTVDLTDEEKRNMAYLESCIMLLNQMGCIDMDKVKAAFPPPFTRVQETVWVEE
jgi:hypothetical protein